VTLVEGHTAPASGQARDASTRKFRFPRRPAFLRARRRRNADKWVAREHRRRRWQIALTGLALVLIGALVWIVWFSSVLAVKQVRVVGLSSEGDFAGIGIVETSAGIPVGTPLIRVDTAAAHDRVAALPWIESTEVYRSWPNGIVVEVVERTPVAVVEQGEARLGVDAAGVLFDPPGGLWLTDPLIRGEEAALAEAVAVVASLPEEIERRVKVVQAVSPDDIRLQLKNDAIVRWGSAKDGEFKAQVLLALIPRRAQSYDVSAPQLPTTFGEKGPRN